MSKNPQEAERIISKGEKKPSPQTSNKRKTPKQAQELRDLGYSLEEIKGLFLQKAEEIISMGTRKGEPTKEEIDQAANEAATSTENNTPQPTEGQKKAGNYKLGHVNIQGLDISIENPKGSTRSGTDKNGKKWEIELQNHYGYIKGTKGKDKDHLDVFIGSNSNSDKVYIVNQIDPATGKFDEHKIVLGLKTKLGAKRAYNSNYEKGWKGLGSIHELSMDEFKTWLKEGDTTKEYATQNEATEKGTEVKLDTNNESSNEAQQDNLSSEPKEVPKKLSELSELPELSEDKPEHEDVGEKIGGAKKDIWRQRGGLVVDDLDSMTEWEEYQYVTKDEVWQKINYQEVVEGGVDKYAVRIIKHIRDRIPIRPVKDTAEYRRGYVTMLNRIKEAASKVKDLSDIRTYLNISHADVEGNVWNGLLKEEVGYRREVKLDAISTVYSIGNATKNLHMSEWDYQKLKRKADEENFPSEKKTSKKKETKATPKRPYLDHVTRTGEDFREGRNVTGDDFLKDFGFRGIEYGNWVKQEEMQKNLNLAYDSLMDLASILGIPPNSISLGGRLGLAFGSRGGGNASAHYEPGKVVINLTKPRGAGTLAHEFAHALDHYFGELDFDKKGKGAPVYASHGVGTLLQMDKKTGAYTSKEMTGMRPEMKEAFEQVRNTINSKVLTQEEMIKVFGNYSPPTDKFSQPVSSE